MSNLAWSPHEIPETCFYRKLIALEGDADLRHSGDLPVDASWDRITRAISEYPVVAVKASPGSGKTMKLPYMLHEQFPCRPDSDRKYPVLVVVLSNLAAEELIKTFVLDFWPEEALHLKTGEHDRTKFDKQVHQMSIITYGILWKWISTFKKKQSSPLMRYGGVLLDEFADFDPQSKTAVRALGRLVQRDRLRKSFKIVAAGYGITPDYVSNLLGEHQFIVVHGRHYTLERCIVAPKTSKDDVLVAAAELARAAISRQGDRSGAVLIFLPGMFEMRTVEDYIVRFQPRPRITTLHSDLIGHADEEHNHVPDDYSSNHVILSTTVGARSITYPNLRYVIIHPAMRSQAMGASGVDGMFDVPVSEELRGNMEGRVGRKDNGLVTFLFEFDDSSTGLNLRSESSGGRLGRMRDRPASRSRARQANIRAPPTKRCRTVDDDNRAPLRRKKSSGLATIQIGRVRMEEATLVLGPPSRLYFVIATMQHLKQRGFPEIRWVRMPEPSELDVYKIDPKARLMTCWAIVVLPLLVKLQEDCGLRHAHVVEDTCLLAPKMQYQNVKDVAAGSDGGMWGYGKHVKKNRSTVEWHGSKGMSVRPPWWNDMKAVVDNMHFSDFKHFDVWLSGRRKKQMFPNIDLLTPLAGFGHRPSLTNHKSGTWGGAWVPPGIDRAWGEGRSSMDAYINRNTPDLVSRWVEACQVEVNTLQRNDVSPQGLKLPVAEDGGKYECGLYAVESLRLPVCAETVWNPLGTEQVKLTVPVSFDVSFFQRPLIRQKEDPEIIQYLEQTWQIQSWMKNRSVINIFGRFPAFPEEIQFLADERYRNILCSNLRISARLNEFITFASQFDLRLEATSIACLLETNAATFSIETAAIGTNSAPDSPPLVVLAGVLPQLQKFLSRVRQAASEGGTSHAKTRISVRKLHTAESLFDKLKEDNGTCMDRSEKTPAQQNAFLAHCLAGAVPEYVAYQVGDHWYATGVRVRGAAATQSSPPEQRQEARSLEEKYRWPWDDIPAVDTPLAVVLQRRLLVRPQEKKYLQKGDVGQKHLTATFSVALKPMKVLTACILGDSSIASAGVRYALAVKLRAVGVVVLWAASIPGAKATDLTKAWEKAPNCQFAMTIYNGNDFTNTKREVSEIDNEIVQLADAAGKKASAKAMFFMNDPKFFPSLGSEYAERMKHARETVRERSYNVYDGIEYLEQIQLRDKLHFSPSSLQYVAAMYAQPIVDYMQEQFRVTPLVPQKRRNDDIESYAPTEVSVESDEESDPLTKPADDEDDEPELPGDAADQNYRIPGLLDDDAALTRRFNVLKEILEDSVTITTKVEALKLLPLHHRLPASLREGDTRFEPKRINRTFFCDACGHMVRQGRLSQNTGHRVEGQFQGSYADSSWALAFAARFQERAWEEGLIDATWYCRKWCKAKPTTVEDRMKRTKAWRASRGVVKKKARVQE